MRFLSLEGVRGQGRGERPIPVNVPITVHSYSTRKQETRLLVNRDKPRNL